MTGVSNKDIWLFLQEIKTSLIKDKSLNIVWSIFLREDEYKKDVEIFKRLEFDGALRLHYHNYPPAAVHYKKYDETADGKRKYLIYFTVIEPKFESIFQSFKTKDLTQQAEEFLDVHKERTLEAMEKKLEEINEKITSKEEIQKEQVNPNNAQNPILFNIEGQRMELADLQERLEAISQIKKGTIKKFPYKLAAGTKWQDFIVKFLDDYHLSIWVKQYKHIVDYKEIGMIGKGKNPNPSEAWVFLKVLAMVNGELTIKDIEQRDKYKKQKELLAKALQNYFSIDYDPFYPYRSSSEKVGNSYKIKITLIPPKINDTPFNNEIR